MHYPLKKKNLAWFFERPATQLHTIIPDDDKRYKDDKEYYRCPSKNYHPVLLHSLGAWDYSNRTA